MPRPELSHPSILWICWDLLLIRAEAGLLLASGRRPHPLCWNTRSRSPGQTEAGGSPGPSVFQLAADCSWWVTVDSAAALWSSAAVTCHTSVSEPGKTLFCPPPHLALEPFPWRSSHESPPAPRMDLLAAEELLQSVHLLGAPVQAPCPGNRRNLEWGAQGRGPGEGLNGPGGLCPAV